jgi:hypothetical protein
MFFGAIGIRYDQPRTLAVICTLIAGGLIAFYLATVGAAILCR